MTDPGWAEREYNPRHLVPDAGRIYERWPGLAAATRARRPPLTSRYGDHPRETLDLFPAGAAQGGTHGVSHGTVLFIHGGYWRAFAKDDFSWIADGFVDQGFSVAILNYPLCPDVTLARIVESTRRGFVHLWQNCLGDAERRQVVVTGHSAGGYLSALHLATDWTTLGLPENPIDAIVPISGVFALAPLIDTSMNAAIGLDAGSADALSLMSTAPLSRARVAFVVGRDESGEFHRQSHDMAERWRSLAPTVLALPGRNHFDVIDGLAEPGSALNRLVLGR